jgi:hypothetical protein
MTKHILSKSTVKRGQKGGGLRVAPRLEGVVKNKGIKPVKKKKGASNRTTFKKPVLGEN